jgi:hypothetical protein
LSSWYGNLIFEWRDGGESIVNPYAPEAERKRSKSSIIPTLTCASPSFFSWQACNWKQSARCKICSNRNGCLFPYEHRAITIVISSLCTFRSRAASNMGMTSWADWDKEHINIGLVYRSAVSQSAPGFARPADKLLSYVLLQPL